MHTVGLCHRDIKADNFIFQNQSDESDIILVDFGLAIQFLNFNGKHKLFKVVGTPNYVAPEVLNGNYDERCDIWSAGVILYYMCSGRFPFGTDQSKTIYDSIKEDPVSFTGFDLYSKNLTHLIKELL